MYLRIVSNEREIRSLVPLDMLLPKLITGEFQLKDVERIIGVKGNG